ncbi:hypothetical protein D6779_05280 [Candidatus Parcubacteria bacterium]|nr:MAG: hypothetical protein D6779_05280 [Candidatus Parcubacteria bacterium]
MNVREMTLFIDSFVKTSATEQLIAIRNRMLDYLDMVVDAEDKGAAIKALRMVEDELDARRSFDR